MSLSSISSQVANNQSFKLMNLGRDTLGEVLSFLDLRDMAACSRVSWSWSATIPRAMQLRQKVGFAEISKSLFQIYDSNLRNLNSDGVKTSSNAVRTVVNTQEILSSVLSYLSEDDLSIAKQVCKSFAVRVLEPKRQSLSIAQLLQFFVTLPESESRLVLQSICKRYPRLQRIDYKHTDINRTVMKKLIYIMGRACPNFKEVNGVVGFHQGNGKVVGISLNGPNALTQFFLESYEQEAYPRVATIKLNLSAAPLQFEFHRFFQLFPNTTTLNISQGNYVDDVLLSVIARNCTRLQELDLTSHSKFTMKGWLPLIQKCSDLTTISVSDNMNLDSDCFKALAFLLPKLQELSAARCVMFNNACLQDISKNCRSIRALDLTWCHKVTDQGLSDLASGSKGLVDLNLSNCDRITEEGIKAIRKGCPRLKTLVVGPSKKPDTEKNNEGLKIGLSQMGNNDPKRPKLETA